MQKGAHVFCNPQAQACYMQKGAHVFCNPQAQAC
jgi:hypothetical protein